MDVESSSPGLHDYSYRVLRETWLTRKPRAEAFTVSLLATLVLVGASFAIDRSFFGPKDAFLASGQAVFKNGEVSRLLTTIFAHADLGHLLSNTYLFFILGFFLYGYFGLSLFPIAALLGGVLTNWIVLPTYDPQVTLLGASGVVYWMGGAWLVLFFFLSKQKNSTYRTLRTLGVAIALFMPGEAFEPAISYRTHFVGFVVGAGSGLLQYLVHRTEYRKAEVYETIIEPLSEDPQYAHLASTEDQSST